VQYNVLWGADGSHSRVRDALDRMFENNTSALKFIAGYKEYEIPSNNGKSKIEPVDALHIWPREGGNFFLALPNADGTWTCTMFSTISQPECIANIREDQVVDYFNKEFPSLIDRIGRDKLRKDHKINPFAGLYSIDCKHWHYKGEVVLLGDAAHAVIPHYGLGINAGFEGCRHMFNLIKIYRSQSNPNWSVIFSEYSKYKEHTDILMKAAIKNADELHSHVQQPNFLFEKEVERKLQKLYPTQFIEAHALLSFTNVPMAVCGKQIDLQEKIIKQLCKDKNHISQIDWKTAHNLVNTELIDVFQQKNWYEKNQSKL